MKIGITRTSLMITLALASASFAFADNTGDMRASMGEVRANTSLSKMIDEATEVYSTIVRGPHGEVPASVRNAARCIAVIPNVMTGALVVGGAHGQGVASCKTSSGAWSQPAAISLSQGSFGLQAGAKSTDLVLFFQSKEAESALKRGNFALGSDVSAVAGKYDASVDTAGAGVVAFSRTEGVFAGVSINGSRIGNDQDELASYYGKNAKFLPILENSDSFGNSRYSNKLTSLFPS